MDPLRPLGLPPLLRLLAAVACVCGQAAWAEEPVVRREPQARFVADEAFLAQGGVQYFYDFVEKGADALKASPAYGAFRELDPARRWVSLEDPVYVVMVRVVYLLDKDVSFFSRDRVLDAGYMNRVCPTCGIQPLGSGLYRVKQMPANTSRVRHLAGGALQQSLAEGWLRPALALSSGLGAPEIVVLQENFDFESILGMRTGERSVTVTTHHAAAPGKTRVAVHMVTWMHNVPPFFLGGAGRVHDATLEGTLSLVKYLRRYAAD